ncbi:MAG: hypothetical protein KIT56_05735 [Gammaproteobacteria bacterium]|nr:hypothetical protein [Gammaproteobacteria bacterium]MCW5583370.1 hypothetical protein [Gammaproteobacteria bacterium]
MPAKYLDKPINYFIWLTNHWPEMLTDYASNFDTANGISIAEKNNKYTIFFALERVRIIHQL